MMHQTYGCGSIIMTRGWSSSFTRYCHTGIGQVRRRHRRRMNRTTGSTTTTTTGDGWWPNQQPPQSRSGTSLFRSTTTSATRFTSTNNNTSGHSDHHHHNRMHNPLHRTLSSSSSSTITSSTSLPLPVLYKYLHLEQYTPQEMELIFQHIVAPGRASRASSSTSTTFTTTITNQTPPQQQVDNATTHSSNQQQQQQHDTRENNNNNNTIMALTQQNVEIYLRKRVSELELEHDLSNTSTSSSNSHDKRQTLHPPALSSSEFESTTTPPPPTITSRATDPGHDRGWTTTSLKPEYDHDRNAFIQQEATRILHLLQNHNNNNDHQNNNNNNTDRTVLSPHITKEQFVHRLTTLASQVDVQRSLPVFVSMLLVGVSVGVITPAMPFVVQSLQLTTAQYGHVVAAFGLAKMMGNIPAAILVERHGRKPYMTYSLALIALGVGGIGLAHSFETLYACRLLTGFGVAALSTAGTLMITDISTPLNRASTYAPIMSAFSAGTAVGPALGGIMVDQWGLQTTFGVVGMSYLGVALVNRSLLRETKSMPLEFPWQRQLRESQSTPAHPTKSLKASYVRKERDVETFSDAIHGAFGQWIPLLHDPMIRSVMILNGIYWITIAGGQMTLLPLVLTNDLHYTATQVGQVYMGISIVQIFGNPIFGRLIDRVGKVPVIIGATTCIGTAMYTLPYACSFVVDPGLAASVVASSSSSSLLGASSSSWPLIATLGLWSVGSSMLSTAPLAYVSDRVDDSKRAQAIALLRTCGDVGFLIGATGTGALADYTNSIDWTMQSNGSLLLCATMWFTLRQLMTWNAISTASSPTSNK